MFMIDSDDEMDGGIDKKSALIPKPQDPIQRDESKANGHVTPPDSPAKEKKTVYVRILETPRRIREFLEERTPKKFSNNPSSSSIEAPSLNHVLRHVSYGRTFGNSKKTYMFTTPQENPVDFDRIEYIYKIGENEYSFKEFRQEALQLISDIIIDYVDKNKIKETLQLGSHLVGKLSLSLERYRDTIEQAIVNKIGNETYQFNKTTLSKELQEDWVQALSALAPVSLRKKITDLRHYMHTTNGLAAQAMGFADMLIRPPHNEKIMLGNREEVIKDVPAPICRYIVEANQDIRIIDTKDFFTVNYSWPQPTGLNDDELTGPALNKKPSAKIIAYSRYATEKSVRRDTHDIRRRIISAALGVSNYDNLEIFSSVETAQALIDFFNKKLEHAHENHHAKDDAETDVGSRHPAIIIEDHHENGDAEADVSSRHSVVTIPLETAASDFLPVISHHFSTFQTQDFAIFGSALNWNVCLHRHVVVSPKTPAEKHQQRYIFEAMEIELASQYSQHAYKMQELIMADNFIELAMLHYILGSLKTQNAGVLQSEENKYGFCVRLLNYLEYYFDEKTTEQREKYIVPIKNMLENISEFNQDLLLRATQYLIIQFENHFRAVKQYYQDLNTFSPGLVWENEKIALRAMGIEKVLYAVATRTENKALINFTPQLTLALSPGNSSVEVLNEFIDFLTRIDQRSFDEITKYLIAVLLEFARHCKRPYRNFEEVPDAAHFDKNIHHLFFTYRARYLLPLAQAAQETVFQLEYLNAYYVLLNGCAQLPLGDFKIENMLKAYIKVLINPFKPFQRVLVLKESDRAPTLESMSDPQMIVMQKEKSNLIMYWRYANEILGWSLSEFQVRNILQKLPASGKIVTDAELIKLIMKTYPCNLSRWLKEKWDLITKENKSLSSEDMQKWCVYLDNLRPEEQSSLINKLFTELCNSVADVPELDYSVTNPTGAVRCIDNYFYLSCATRHVFVIFNQLMDDCLEKIRAASASNNFDVYYYALILRHFYMIFLADHLQKEPPIEKEQRVFFYHDQSGWTKTFNADVGFVNNSAVILHAIQTINDCICQSIESNTTADSYINALEQSFQSKSLLLLKKKHRSILYVCAWMAALVNRHAFSTDQIIWIYKNIKLALDRLNLKYASDLWTDYVTLETLGYFAEQVALKRLGQSPSSANLRSPSMVNNSPLGSSIVSNNLLYQSNIKHLETEYADPIERLLYKGENLLCSTSLQPLEETLLRHIIVRFVAVTTTKMTTEKNGSVSKRYSVGLDENQQKKQKIIQIYIVLALLYLKALSPQPKLASELLDCALHDISLSPGELTLTRRTALLNLLLTRWKNWPELFADPIVRAVFFAAPAYKIFSSLDFISAINQRFSLDVSNVEHLDIIIFLNAIKEGLHFTLTEIQSNPACHQFFIYFMAPFLDSFYIIYNQLCFGATQTLPGGVTDLWQECINGVNAIAQKIRASNRVAAKALEIFVHVWAQIKTNIFANVTPNMLSQSIPLLMLRKRPLDMLMAYHACIALNLKDAKQEAGRLWKDGFATFNLSDEIIDTLYFIFKPTKIYGLSNSINAQLRPNINAVQQKIDELMVFLTTEEKTWYRSSFHPVREVQSLARVLCVLVDGNYYSYLPTKHLSRRNIDTISHHLKRIYEMRLKILDHALRALSTPSLDPKDRDILRDFVLSAPLHHPVAFIYGYRGEWRCREIYQEDQTIQCKNVLARDSVLLKQAACALSENEANEGLLIGIIRCQTSEAIENGVATANISRATLKTLIDWLHDAMALIQTSYSAPKIPITAGVMPSPIIYDDPSALGKRNVDELRGLLLLALVYKIFSLQDYQQRGSANQWLLNLSNFFQQRKNVVDLGKNGVNNLLTFGPPKKTDPVRVKLTTFDQTFPPNLPLDNYPTLYKNNSAFFNVETVLVPAQEREAAKGVSTSGSIPHLLFPEMNNW